MERLRPKKSYNNSRFTVTADPTTFFRILCPSSHLTAVTANINSVRRDTGARIDVHRLIPDDGDRIIETSDVLRRGPDGRISHYSPARKAFLLVHALILKSESDGSGGWGKDRRWAGRVTRLVVSKNNIGWADRYPRMSESQDTHSGNHGRGSSHCNCRPKAWTHWHNCITRHMPSHCKSMTSVVTMLLATCHMVPFLCRSNNHLSLGVGV